MTRTVVVAQPGSHHVWRVAVACERAGLLASYVTSIVYRPDQFPFSLLSLLPRSFRIRITRELSRRARPDITPRHIRTRALWEWLHLFADRTHAPQRLARWFVDRRNTAVSHAAGHAAASARRVLWSGMDSSREAFRIAHPAGAHCILDAFIGHPRRLNEVLEEECRRAPGLRSVIKDWVPRARAERMEEEVALADSIVVGSRFAGETFTARGVPPSKVVTVPYGSDTTLFVPRVGRSEANGDGPFRLLFVGNVSVRKGSHYLLEAMRTLAAERVTLTLIGTMEDRYFLEQYGTAFNWVPFVRHADLPSYFRNADAYVFPSLFEGSALSVYEALASGLPVVTTDESGSVVRDGIEGLIIPSRDSDAIVHAVRTLMGTPELRGRLGTNARRRAEEFTWDTYGTRVVDLVRRLG